MICINGQHQQYYGGTLLDSLKQTNSAPVSHCESGFCGQCRTKLIKGEIDYIGEPIGFVSAGEILPCICKPVGDIEIVFSTL